MVVSCTGFGAGPGQRPLHQDTGCWSACSSGPTCQAARPLAVLSSAARPFCVSCSLACPCWGTCGNIYTVHMWCTCIDTQMQLCSTGQYKCWPQFTWCFEHMLCRFGLYCGPYSVGSCLQLVSCELHVCRSAALSQC
jgi:hypothetical protein